ESQEAIADSISAQSSTVHAIGPTQSIDGDKGRTPRRLTRPFVGFIPVTPHQAAGSRMELAVSVPTEPAHRPTATDAADPLDEDDGSKSRFHGLRVGGHGSSNDVPLTAYSAVACLPR